MSAAERTAVGIIGAGPAGLLLARLLHRAGVECVVLEHRTREHVEQRQRAGTLEQSTVDALRAVGAGDRLDREARFLDGIELRYARNRHPIDFTTLAGGRGVAVYPQTKIVQDLIALHAADGPPVRFEAQARTVADVHGSSPAVRYTWLGQERELRCDVVVGADGSLGVGRRTVLAEGGTLHARGYPFAWYGVMADVAPSCATLLYAHSTRGFALHSMRSPLISRLYFQVPPRTRVEDWHDDAIWAELAARFAVDEDWTLTPGPITSRVVVSMRSEVVEPMRTGRLVLAGDAAHVVPPTGAKGLNLAIADVLLLSEALIRMRAGEPDTLLDEYCRISLRRAWEVEYFSWALTHAMHVPAGQAPFDTRLQLTYLARITGPAGAEFAQDYVGRPLTGLPS